MELTGSNAADSYSSTNFLPLLGLNEVFMGESDPSRFVTSDCIWASLCSRYCGLAVYLVHHTLKCLWMVLHVKN